MLQVGRNSINDDRFSLTRLEAEAQFKCEEIQTFDCGKDDLNDFFHNDAFDYSQQLLATTYYFQPREATEEKMFVPVAFVSFLNDSIDIEIEERKTCKKDFFKLLRKNLPSPKWKYKSYPAVKIGRLGVTTKYQRSDIGSSLLNLTKNFFLSYNRTGCRFLTVDAYNCDPQINFYKKNGFDFLWYEDAEKDTRIMFFDLMRHQIE